MDQSVLDQSVLDHGSAQEADDGGAQEVRTYWRRRFVVLITGLAAFGLLAWGLSVAFSPSPGVIGGTSGQPGAAAGSGGPVSPGRAGAGVATRSTAGVSPSASASPTAGATATASGSASPVGQAGTVITPPYCSRRDIVLSLSPGLTDFPAGQVPSFSVSVVSTAAADCSFNLGPAYLAVVVSEGPVRIWSSADCVRGTGGLLTALKRGVPTVLQINWNRKTSAPGCSGPMSRVPAGSYVARAVQGSVSSGRVSFRLG